MSVTGWVPLEELLVAEDEQKRAFEAKIAIEKYLDEDGERSLTVRLGTTDETDGPVVSLPRGAVEALVKTLGHITDGNGILVMPIQPEVSTQQAADFLHVSRPHLVRMLERGELRYRNVGTRRRIKLKELLAYRQRQLTEQRDVLDDLAAAAVFTGPSR